MSICFLKFVVSARDSAYYSIKKTT